MSLPCAVALAALLSLPSSLGLPEHSLGEPALPDQESVFIIARPEASDAFVSTRTRVSANDLLVRNPELIRAARKEDVPYDLRAAVDNGWEALRQSDLPIARAVNGLHPATTPEPDHLLLLSLSSLLLLRRRRIRNFGGTRTDRHQPANHHWKGFETKS